MPAEGLLHDLVLERDDCLEAAPTALAAAATEELAVDAPRIVTLGGEHVQAAELGHARCKPDIGAPPGHVGRHGDGSAAARLGDDLGFGLILSCVQHLV